MMRNLGRYGMAGGSLLAAGALVLLACETDLTPVGTLDASIPETSVVDTFRPDVEQPDANDGGPGRPDADAGPGFTPESLRAAAASALCARSNTCCNGKDGEGGTFDNAICLGYLQAGIETSFTQVSVTGVLASNLTVDQALATACVEGLKTLACLNVNPGISAAAYKKVTQECFGAIKGKVAANGACRADIECSAGLFCDGAFTPGMPPVYAAGTCKPLAKMGEPCRVTDTQAGDNCSRLGSGDTGLYCDVTTTNTCVPLVAVGQACGNSNLNCASGACQDSTCANAKVDSFACYIGGPRAM